MSKGLCSDLLARQPGLHKSDLAINVSAMSLQGSGHLYGSSMSMPRISKSATSRPPAEDCRPAKHLAKSESVPLKKVCIETLHKAALQHRPAARVSMQNVKFCASYARTSSMVRSLSNSIYNIHSCGVASLSIFPDDP